MRTLILKTIDGIEIVAGFNRKVIDGVATRKAVMEALEKLPESKDLKIASANYYTALDKNTSEDKKKTLIEKMKKAKEQFDEKMKDLHGKLVKFFEIKKGEKEVSNEEYLDYLNLKQEANKKGKMLGIDKSEVSNLKGLVYYIKNGNKITKHKIDKIGFDIPDGATLNLSREDAQSLKDDEEVEAILNMKNEDKDKMLQFNKSKILKETSIRIIELELDGMTEVEAKEIAFKEYNDSLVKLKDKYKKN